MCVFWCSELLAIWPFNLNWTMFFAGVFTATFRVPLRIPGMSLGQLSDASTNCTNIRPHWGVIGHVLPYTPLRASYMCASARNVIIPPPPNMLRSIQHVCKCKERYHPPPPHPTCCVASNMCASARNVIIPPHPTCCVAMWNWRKHHGHLHAVCQLHRSYKAFMLFSGWGVFKVPF